MNPSKNILMLPFLNRDMLEGPNKYGEAAGVVPYEIVQRRRAKNRVARKSRRINRLRAS